MKLFRLTLFTFVAMITFSSSTQSAHAYTYAIGDVYITGNINSGSYLPGGTIVVDGSITNNNPYAGGVPAYLSASTNGSTQAVVSQTLSPGSFVNGVVYLTAPSAPGSHSVAFSAGANIPPVEQTVNFSVGISKSTTPCWDMCTTIVASVSLAQPLSQSVTLYIEDQYFDSSVWASGIVSFTITIPAGQTYGFKEEAVYSAGGWVFGGGDISSSGQTTTLGGVPTKQLLTGILLPVYGNTKLRLTNAAVSYYASCYDVDVGCY